MANKCFIYNSFMKYILIFLEGVGEEKEKKSHCKEKSVYLNQLNVQF